MSYHRNVGRSCSSVKQALQSMEAIRSHPGVRKQSSNLIDVFSRPGKSKTPSELGFRYRVCKKYHIRSVGLILKVNITEKNAQSPCYLYGASALATAAISASHLSPFDSSFSLLYSSSSLVSVAYSALGVSTIASTGQLSWHNPQ